MTLLWLKAFHVFFMVAWMAGIFYLPRLFVYHASTDIDEVKEQFKVMERRLWLFVTPFAVITFCLGIIIIYMYGWQWFSVSSWLHIKLVLVVLVYVYHFYLYTLLRDFALNKNTKSSRFYRFLNETPVIILLIIVILAIVKPTLP